MRLFLLTAALFFSLLHAQEDPTLRKNVILVFDDSGSMAANDKLRRAQDATAEFIRRLPDSYNLGIYALNRGYIFELQPLDDAKKQALIGTIRHLRADGRTPLAKAIRKMTKVLFLRRIEQAGYGTYTIVIATDGAADSPQAMFKAVDQSINEGIIIKTIGIDIYNHGLQRVTEFTKASSTQQLTAAMQKAIRAEVDVPAGFIPQDF